MFSNVLRKALRMTSVLALCTLPIAAYAFPLNSINQIYFFGDSLTDSGFINYAEFAPSGNPTKAPTFTTYGGFTWAQYVAHDLKGYPLPSAHPAPPAQDLITNNMTPLNPPGTSPLVVPVLSGIDYACGGSTTNSIGYPSTFLPFAPSLRMQVAYYLSTAPKQLDPNNVYFIWSGANDILTVLTAVPAPTQLQLLQTAKTAATNIANEVALLAARGAKRVVVFSLPNLGSAPLATGSADKTLPGTLKTLSFTFDSMINTALGNVIKRTGIKVLYIDTYTLLDNVVKATQAGQPYVVAGKSFIFTNYLGMACGGASALFCPSGAPLHYVFADSVHPTDEAHQVIALTVETMLQNWA